MDTYTHGHAEPVLQSHRWRTAENSAAYLLPSLRPGLDLLDDPSAQDMKEEAMGLISGSARKLDLLFWTGYRLRALQRPLRLTWDNLHRQFGAENASLRSRVQSSSGRGGGTPGR